MKYMGMSLPLSRYVAITTCDTQITVCKVEVFKVFIYAYNGECILFLPFCSHSSLGDFLI